MASFFGEIIEPSTRAIFEEFSDDEENIKETEVRLSWTQGGETIPSVFDVTFIIHGRLSLAFAEAYLLDKDSNPVGEMILEDGNWEEEHCKNLPSRIYIYQNQAICLVSPSFPSDIGFKFTETISPLLKMSKKVIIMTNDSIYNFKTPSLNELPPAFVKELMTSYNSSTGAASPLPSPNFITGIPAAVLTWCEIKKKNGSAFIIYTDQQKLDSVTASPFVLVLRNLNSNIIRNENPDFNQRLFYGKPEIIGGSSNIYI